MACVALVGVANAQSWRYVDIADERVDLVLEREPGRLSVGHRMFSVQYCGERDSMLCFKSEAASFAIPKSVARARSTVLTRWTHEGNEFVLRAVSDKRVLGQTMALYTVEAIGAAPPIQFFFSPVRGVVAIKLAEDSARPLVLEASCGYGAAKECR